jgi:hypothetical protein
VTLEDIVRNVDQNIAQPTVVALCMFAAVPQSVNVQSRHFEWQIAQKQFI